MSRVKDGPMAAIDPEEIRREVRRLQIEGKVHIDPPLSSSMASTIESAKGKRGIKPVNTRSKWSENVREDIRSGRITEEELIQAVLLYRRVSSFFTESSIESKIVVA